MSEGNCLTTDDGVSQACRMSHNLKKGLARQSRKPAFSLFPSPLSPLPLTVTCKCSLPPLPLSIGNGSNSPTAPLCVQKALSELPGSERTRQCPVLAVLLAEFTMVGGEGREERCRRAREP